MLTYSKAVVFFITAWIINLRFFVWAFSKTLIVDCDKLLASTLLYRHVASEAGMSNRVCYLKVSALFLLVLGVVSENYITRKCLFILWLYKYTFTFKLTTTLLQKLAAFYMWIVKEKLTEWTKTHFTVVMVTVWLQVRKHK